MMMVMVINWNEDRFPELSLYLSLDRKNGRLEGLSEREANRPQEGGKDEAIITPTHSPSPSCLLWRMHVHNGQLNTYRHIGIILMNDGHDCRCCRLYYRF